MGIFTKTNHFCPEIWTSNSTGTVGHALLCSGSSCKTKGSAIVHKGSAATELSWISIWRQMKNKPQREFEMPHWELTSMYYSVVIELTLPSSLVFGGITFCLSQS